MRGTAQFTLEGGAIEGNTAYSEYTYGGGVYVGRDAQFIMEGGAITGNTAKATNTANGGGVYVGGTFHMSGGTIAENTAKGDTAYDRSVAYGGGVYVTNTFNMSGGTITGNTIVTNGFESYSGINMYIMSTFTMSGGYMENEADNQNKISGDGTISVTGGYFAASPDEDWLSSAVVQQISSTADDPNFVAGYLYAVYHQHAAADGQTAITFKPLPYDLSESSGLSGNFYLHTGRQLDSALTISGTSALCLNGHALTGSGSNPVVTVNSGGALTLYDCSTDQAGVISGSVTSNGAFTMNSGTITGGVMGSGSFTMSGGYLGGNIENTGAVSLTGGYFASSPSGFLTDGGYTTVNLSADTNHYGDTGYKDGYPYAVYQNGNTEGYRVSDVSITYGSTYTPEVSGTTATPSYSYMLNNVSYNDLPSNAGTYTVTAAFASSIDGASKMYYPEKTVTFTVTIEKQKVAVPVAESGLVYNGSAQTGVVVADGMNGIYTISNGSATDANTYPATATLVDSSNYEWATTGFNGKVSWSIAQKDIAGATVTLGTSLTYTGQPQTQTVSSVCRFVKHIGQ